MRLSYEQRCLCLLFSAMACTVTADTNHNSPDMGESNVDGSSVANPSVDAQSYVIDLPSNTAIIAPQAFLNAQGRVAINQSAGVQNSQTNSHAIGGQVVILSNQKNPYIADSTYGDAINQTSIEELAFENSQGLISINQVSGQGNIQANLGAIALQSVVGFGLDDKSLESVTSPSALPIGHLENNQSFIAPDSFENVQGIVQINQISGDGNTAINQFSLQLPSGN